VMEARASLTHGRPLKSFESPSAADETSSRAVVYYIISFLEM
jgi:hypothetical protein